MDFEDGIDGYLNGKIGGYSPSTLGEQRRKLAMFGARLGDLKDRGTIPTTDPREMDEMCVRWFVQDMKDRGLDVSTQKKYLEMLNGMLRHHGNMAAENVRAAIRLDEPTKPVETLTRDQCIQVFEHIEGLGGWRGSVTRGMIYLAYQTWARPSEIRTARLIDLDMAQETFYIRNPKGRGTFASGQRVDLVMKGSLYLLERYLRERSAYLASKGVDSAHLFPRVVDGRDAIYSQQAAGRMIQDVSEALGFHFSLKTFRATMTYLTVNEDPAQLANVSKQLRHNSLATTQRFYEGLARDNVGDRMRPATDRIDFMRRRSSPPDMPGRRYKQAGTVRIFPNCASGKSGGRRVPSPAPVYIQP